MSQDLNQSPPDTRARTVELTMMALVPKGEKDWRPVINMSVLNKFVDIKKIQKWKQ